MVKEYLLKNLKNVTNIDWYEIENIPENTLSHIKTALNHIKNKVPISEIREIN